MVKIKRVYDGRSPEDGYRVLVDLRWPKGVRKESAAIDEWAKILAPSAELLGFFWHNAKKWAAFNARYRAQLNAPSALEALERLSIMAKRGTVTLVYASRDTARNNAAVLKDLLESR
ncbi:MAG: hypothetical protein A2506_03105 [Elusimicrobia bacterium RIFOXYD12_FULL_66_9]|nr:MAG: hypothetical protein A2506_03105 [Elusimicrobia bacterium RIFOXYD12_FULL_66_9]